MQTKADHTIGGTDEIGAQAVECVHHIRDVHVTILHPLGLGDNKLTMEEGGWPVAVVAYSLW
jgi:hypothetical protein